jgi:N6-L-threonylcarbamoyladenine synthase
MICLGIESTAHTFGIGIITSTGKVLANAKESYSTDKGGLIPNEVAAHHERVKEIVLQKALESAKLNWNEISLISYSHGPGLPPSLWVGCKFASKIAEEHKIPLIGANHAVAHLTIGNCMTGAKDPIYLYVSGVNTQVIANTGNKLRIFGETLDIGLGNALDKLGRAIGLGFPAGPKIETLAQKGEYIDLPYVVKGMDVSFSGLVTKTTQLAKKHKPEDLAFSFQETCFAMLAEVAERAMAHTDKKELLLVGGVAANKRLSEMLTIMCQERGAKFHATPLEYTGDQGAMIAWQGILNYVGGLRIKETSIYPYERVDEVQIVW